MKALRNFPTTVQTTRQTANSIFKWFVVDRLTPGTAVNVTALPAELIPVHCTVQSMGAVSNAATTATISVGFKGGTGAELVPSVDVKANKATIAPVDISGLVIAGPTTPATFADKQITATYAETGAASTAGGPWLVALECMQNSYR